MRKAILTILILGFLVLANMVVAQGLINPDVIDANKQENTRISSGLFDQATNETTMTQYIAYVVNVFLGLLGTVFLVLIIVAGYNLLTAQGESAKVVKAQTIIRTAIIGLVIITAAYALTYWIFARLPDNQDRSVLRDELTNLS
ncbi:hypothetical protein COT94_02020 [Candidatus Falkowbacteria bacterium CG10_big_fil_rev_8_21_14_0_10_37_14]|uniref:Uncharacterized protein n=1 Tax=Candidatus Falkowbacteria bacterium CG10_big_fil_rev_8_21_14_0_10_37_14 TaxID=1974561 RepID=A0A2M6WT96_9BACT|nr:hypothetical protein [Candidatus Falkowbacteria bacterium]PIT96020.1 MAG: hypothetical protein COT94_02020 [Candidatus Falkowbacteria bacterium CG10_big_fil_rev_8_21_14_0_10_37_14]